MKQFIGIADISALSRWVNSVTKGHFTVRFSPSAKTASINGEVMTLPRLNADVSIRDLIRLRGFCLHETSHAIYQADAFKVLDENKMKDDSPLFIIYNLICDAHAESCRAHEWPGDAKALSEFGAVTGRDVTDNLKQGLAAGGELSEDMIKLTQVMYASVMAEGQWNTGLRVGFGELFHSILPPEIITEGDALAAKFDLNKRLIDTNETPRTLWQLAKDIFEYLFEMPADSQTNQPAKGEGEKGEGEGEPESGTSDDSGDDGDGDEEGEGEGAGNEHDPNAKGTGSDTKGKGKLNVKTLVRSSHYTNGKSGGGHGMGFDYSAYTERNSYVPIEFNQFKIVEF